MNRPDIKVWDTTFPLDCVGSEPKKADGLCKNEYHSKYHSEGRRNDHVLKIDDKMNTVNGTKQESGNENKTK